MLSFVVDLAREAGAILREGLEHPREITFKGRADLVTDIDLRSERLIVHALNEHFPDHAVVGEEGGGSADARYVWLVDPLDGTTNYAHGYPVFGVTLALLEQGEIVLGVTYDPLRDECFTAERGKGAWLNGRQLRVSGTPTLRTALLSTGFPYHRFHDARDNVAQLSAVLQHCQGIARSGSAALDLAYVAMGRSDGHWEISLKPWDCAAGALMIREAGGRVTNWGGAPFDPWQGWTVATNGAIHDELLLVLATTPE
jgi:myo-inositol-1(or 4)-monophosphatase